MKKNRRARMYHKLRKMREDSKQFEDQLKRMDNLQEFGRISFRKRRGVIQDVSGDGRAEKH